MPLKKRHKYVIAGLAVYWPLIFAATHLPIQHIGRQTGMSDKVMHWLAYLGLVFFLWLAVSPYEKVNWRKAKVWIILAVLVWYGAVDEWLQSYVGRGASVDDFRADMFGALVGLGLLSVFSFWPAALAVTAVFIFTITNRSCIEMLWNQPYLNTAFHFAGYAAFTLVWIQYLDRKLPDKVSAIRWIILSTTGPLALLAFVKISSLFFDKRIWVVDCLTAVVAIVLSTVVSRFICKTIWLDGDQSATAKGV
jgi:VanZ family protein